MNKYTLGFVFNEELNRVVLIELNKPNRWNDRLINGVGGHIEEGEEPLNCMSRECMEESGINIPPANWRFVGIYEGVGSKEVFKIHVYYTTTKQNLLVNSSEGSVSWYDVSTVAKLKTVSNLQWMMPYCLAHAKREILGSFHANYHEDAA
jgi:8-oxo-dGTP pyrophosphatase MutT (NUDIX family)